jgi:hypothetical protein
MSGSGAERPAGGEGRRRPAASAAMPIGRFTRKTSRLRPPITSASRPPGTSRAAKTMP